jgi:FtsZ-interacting cell division protein YlmF
MLPSWAPIGHQPSGIYSSYSQVVRRLLRQIEPAKEAVPANQLKYLGCLLIHQNIKTIPKITFVEPEKFHDGKVLQAMECIVNKRVVIAGLVMMEPDQAQRAVDYLAGATEALKGHCERIAQSTFVFTPSGMPIEFGDSNPSSDADKIDVREPSPPLLTGLNE